MNDVVYEVGTQMNTDEHGDVVYEVRVSGAELDSRVSRLLAGLWRLYERDGAIRLGNGVSAGADGGAVRDGVAAGRAGAVVATAPAVVIGW